MSSPVASAYLNNDERRYVLLRHECPADYRDGPHWDLMIEDGDALRTWSLLELPAAWGGEKDAVVAEELPPHRLAYLDREGEVSGNRGHVKRIARGKCELTTDEPALVVAQAAGELSGEWRIEKTEQAWRIGVTKR